jgi:hypothetical protein
MLEKVDFRKGRRLDYALPSAWLFSQVRTSTLVNPR